MNVIILRSLVTASLMTASTSAVAQAVDESALDRFDNAAPVGPVIREPAGAADLRAAMRRIAMQPSDADALADAGNAALMLGDANAALNFFTRANAIRPRNGKITSGLAIATVRTENPFEALRLFDDAVKLGISERTIAADRALAFDLLGNFARAQQDYQLARSASLSDDLVIRQAISLSLAGQKSAADGMLLPLLQKNNGSAWRARAFMLAARGDARESIKVVQGFMDARSAQKMERYLKLMPDLTAAQQAAAIHLGHFPASNIGRDSENVRRVAATIPTPALAKNESRLIPTGEPLGKKTTNEKPVKEKRSSRRERQAAAEAKASAKSVIAPLPVRVAQLDKPGLDRSGLATNSARLIVDSARVSTIAVTTVGALPTPETARPLVDVALPNAARTVSSLPAGMPIAPSGSAIMTHTVLPSTSVTQPGIQSVANPAVSSSPTTTGIVQGPTQTGIPLAQTAPVFAPATQSVSAPVPTAVVPVTAPVTTLPFDLAAVVGSIEIPDSEQKPSTIAVDLRKLRAVAAKPTVAEAVKTAKVDLKTLGKAEPKIAAKADPKALAKAVAVAHPARFWVQIATGEAGALGYDYRKWAKKSADLLKGQSGWTSRWGKTDRLLVGPFADLKASKKWEADFRKAGGDGFAWKSENGVVVTALKGK